MSTCNLIGDSPESFEKLSNLVHLDLAMNYLTGKIPVRLWMLEKLETPKLHDNKLSGDTTKMIGVKSLVQIDIST